MGRTVTVATVTYGDRHQLLRAVLDGLASLHEAEAIVEVIVVDNGSSAATKELLEEGRVSTVVDLGVNQGSAAGFAAAIEAAIASGSDFVWLLDDDNVPRPDALTHLFAAVEANPPGCALQAMRPNYPELHRLVSGEPTKWVFGSPNAFLDSAWVYHLRGHRPPIELTPYPDLLWGMYGGLFAPTESVASVSGPPIELFLYADDTVFTSRLAATKGFKLVPDAVIDDVDDPWWLGEKRKPAEVIATTSGDAALDRLYYTVRNTLFFQKTHRRTSRVIFYANAVHRYLRQIRACVAASWQQRSTHPLGVLALFHSAVRDALRGRLGPRSGAVR